MRWQFTGSANSLWGEELQGYAEFKPQLPGKLQASLFQPGKVKQIRMRMFNLSRGDDASNDFRGAFLKVKYTKTYIILSNVLVEMCSNVNTIVKTWPMILFLVIMV